MTDPQVVVLRAAGTSLVLDVAGPTLPRVLHWGRDLGEPDTELLSALALTGRSAAARSGLDEAPRLPVIPTEHDGWSGTPGLVGHRAGADSAPRLELFGAVDIAQDPAGGGSVRAVARGGDLEVAVTLTLGAFGVVRSSVTVTNIGSGHYDLGGVLAMLPLPADAQEVLDLTGRWCRERSPQRAPLRHGTHVRAGRRGRTGHDSPLLLTAGTPGFGFRSGEVWATHVAWSGDSVHLIEQLPEGAGAASSLLAGGESLRAGEVRLGPGETYRSPETVFVWSGVGLDGLSRRLHETLRARPGHPRSPRPVVLNVWEAVYFDHDLATLTRLADVAASVGVERFVLDDGWFGSRRDDTSGLGDWYVSPEVWPDGLGPLVEHVRSRGMQFGLWVEPEMANPDSDVVRAHPDWLLTPDAPLWRNQQVLDLAHPEAFAYLLGRLDSLVREYGIDYLKWDHNRDLHVALHAGADGRRVAGVHTQTHAVYRLLDQLRERHPGLEIESCSSGGARVDLGILERTDRVWTSDTNDALERQMIQRWTGLLLPPELCGAHVSAPRSHTTSREIGLAFRCITALFGHAGLEWDLSACDESELAVLRRWITLHKSKRPLLHTGETVRADLPGDGALLHGVVSADRGDALFAYVRLESSVESTPPRVRLPGLDPARSYRVRVLDDCGEADTVERSAPPWTTAECRLPGSVLGSVGLPMPGLVPASALLIELTS